MAQPTENPGSSIPGIEAFLKERISLVERGEIPEQYHVFDRYSAQAIRAALASRRPLLVRGEPGVGKTQLAAAAAKVLKRPLVARVVDSRTESRDLLWTFDAVMRLADAQAASSFLPARGRSGSGPGESSTNSRPSPSRTSGRRSTWPTTCGRGRCGGRSTGTAPWINRHGARPLPLLMSRRTTPRTAASS